MVKLLIIIGAALFFSFIITTKQETQSVSESKTIKSKHVVMPLKGIAATDKDQF